MEESIEVEDAWRDGGGSGTGDKVGGVRTYLCEGEGGVGGYRVETQGGVVSRANNFRELRA